MPEAATPVSRLLHVSASSSLTPDERKRGCFLSHLSRMHCAPDSQGQMICDRIRQVLKKCPGQPEEEIEREETRQQPSTEGNGHCKGDIVPSTPEPNHWLKEEEKVFRDAFEQFPFTQNQPYNESFPSPFWSFSHWNPWGWGFPGSFSNPFTHPFSPPSSPPRQSPFERYGGERNDV